MTFVSQMTEKEKHFVSRITQLSTKKVIMMDSFIYILVIFVAGAIPLVEYMLAIPFGIIAGVPTVPVIIAGFFGNLITVILLIRFVDMVWNFINKRKKQRETVSDVSVTADQNGETLQSEHEVSFDDNAEESTYTLKSKRAQRARKLWDKYGVPGLTFFGTALLSSHVTVLMACLFGGNRTYIALWMTISLAIWSLIIGVVFHFGIDAFFR